MMIHTLFLKLLLTAALLLAALLFTHTGFATIKTSSYRDPFIPIEQACPVTNASSTLANWQLLGISGQEQNWLVWLLNEQKQWVHLKEKDAIPNTDYAINSINMAFVELKVTTHLQEFCDIPPKQYWQFNK